MEETARSIGVVRNPRTVSAPAPVYTVVMMTDELSTLGNCCTGSVNNARAPTSTITRLTTIAMTGCLMKMSVNARMFFSLAVPGLDSAARSCCRSDGCHRGGACDDRDERVVAQLDRKSVV